MLGLLPSATAEEVKAAYHKLAKQYHPDLFHDPDEQAVAEQRLTAINLAYREAIRLTSERQQMVYTQELPLEDAKHLARKMMRQENPASAIRQLLRADERDGEWFDLQGQALMALKQYESAYQSFRAAVRCNPDNIEYRRGALDASVAMRKSKTLGGRVQALLDRLKR